MITQAAQLITHASFFSDWLRFKTHMDDLKNVQADLLEKILHTHPYLSSKKDFEKEEIKDYSAVMKSLSGISRPVVRQQPTSGTGEKEKLIPYTQEFITELGKALNPWLFDLAHSHPGILTGKHYWSMSWLPTHWREKGWFLDDFELLPHWKKNLTRALLAVPNEVSKSLTLPASQFATLAYLLKSHDLTFLSVWSPTFLLQLFELLRVWKLPLTETLRTGRWAGYEAELNYLPAPHSPAQAEKLQNLELSELWPRLKLISSWDSSSSTVWAQRLQKLFPAASFQGKGLWATEGVITIPFEKKFVLSYQSHYYEFVDLASGNLLPAHRLKEGMEVHPVLTCANGFTRYRIKDRLAVTGFSKSVPELQFLERDDTSDMVGEKLDTHTFLLLHNLMKEVFPELSWVSVFAVNQKESQPYYLYVFEGDSDLTLRVKPVLHEYLNNHFHYHLARELGQLAAERIHISVDAFRKYEHFHLERGMVQGNIKIELVSKVKNDLEASIFPRFFPS